MPVIQFKTRNGPGRAEIEEDGCNLDCRIVTPDGRDVGSFRLDADLLAGAAPAPQQRRPEGGCKEGDPKRRVIGPGTWLFHAIRAATLGLLRHGLECERRRRAMDEAGWRGLPKLWWGWARDQARKDDPG